MKELIIEKLYQIVKIPYEYLFKNAVPWEVSITDCINLPKESLGFHLGCFLLKYNLEPQPKLEEHDIYHVLTNTGIQVTDEINMQFYLLGNGKKSPFVFMVIATGLVFYPFRIKTYLASYKKGKQAHQFYHLDFLKMLPIPIETIKHSFNIKYHANYVSTLSFQQKAKQLISYFWFILCTIIFNSSKINHFNLFDVFNLEFVFGCNSLYFD